MRKNLSKDAPPKRDKVLATALKSDTVRQVMAQHGFETGQCECTLLCKCANISDANEQCKKAGFHYTVYSAVDSEPYDTEMGMKCCGNENIVVVAECGSMRTGCLPWSQITAEADKLSAPNLPS